MNLRVGGEGGFKNEEHKKKFHSAGGKKVSDMMHQRHLYNLKNNSEYREMWFENYRKAVMEKCTGENNHFFGKSHTDETKKIISNKMKIIQYGKNNSQYGTIWITDGVYNKKIKITDNIPNNWRKGRTL